MIIKSVRGFTPKIGNDCFVAPNVSLIGDVQIGDRSTIWYNVVVRGDVHAIRIGSETNVQDSTIIHATFKKCGTTIGNRVSIGHGVILHGCTVEDGSLIGMGVIIMDNAHVGKHCLIGAGSLVTENTRIEEGWLAYGRPAKPIRKLTPEEISRLEKSADNYLLYKTWYEENA